MRSDVDLCLDQALILTAPEAERLRAELPAGWTDDRLETLERHDTLEEPFDAYSLARSNLCGRAPQSAPTCSQSRSGLVS